MVGDVIGANGAPPLIRPSATFYPKGAKGLKLGGNRARTSSVYRGDFARRRRRANFGLLFAVALAENYGLIRD